MRKLGILPIFGFEKLPRQVVFELKWVGFLDPLPGPELRKPGVYCRSGCLAGNLVGSEKSTFFLCLVSFFDLYLLGFYFLN